MCAQERCLKTILSFSTRRTYLQGKHWAAQGEQTGARCERGSQPDQDRKSRWSDRRLKATGIPNQKDGTRMTTAPLTRCPHRGPAAGGSWGGGPWLVRWPEHEVVLGAARVRGSGSLRDGRSTFLCRRSVLRLSLRCPQFPGWAGMQRRAAENLLWQAGEGDSVHQSSIPGRERRDGWSLMPAACPHPQLAWWRGCQALEQVLSLIRCWGRNTEPAPSVGAGKLEGPRPRARPRNTRQWSDCSLRS